MIVNVGVFRERGLGEPALAALIQEDVHADGDGASTGTFSFDIDNGMCGPLTGMDVVSGFLSSGAVGVGLVVASDSAPGPTRVRGFPHPEAGAAVLLVRDPAVDGLVAGRLATYPEYAGLLEAIWEWRGHSAFPAAVQARGNQLLVTRQAGFVARAVDCAEEVTRRFLADNGVGADDVDLLIATPEPGFADALADRLGIPHERTLHTGEQIGRMHTAQPIAAVDLARRIGRWQDSRTVLMVTAGSGITVATALYRN